MKIFITGLAGTGKTTVINELVRRGYNAYSTEELGLNQHLDTLSSKVVKRPAPPMDYTRYKNIWNLPKIKRLLTNDDLVFIADLNSAQDDYYRLFDKVIVLTIDKETQKDRLLTRNTNPHDYGKHPEDLKRILNVHDSEQAKLTSIQNSVAIDSTQPLQIVIDRVLEQVRQGRKT
jgi:dephospho-CoA kinase